MALWSQECILWSWAEYCLRGDVTRGTLGSGHVIALAVPVRGHGWLAGRVVCFMRQGVPERVVNGFDK